MVNQQKKLCKNYVERNGRPLALYTDFGGVFSVNKSNHNHDKITQFARACKELAISLIHAHSPQAKGRVERSNKTHQDRLIKEMRLRGISKPEDANRFIEKIYLPQHNKRYAQFPAKQENVHRTCKNYNFETIFCIKEKRVVQNNFVVQYKNHILQLTEHQKAIVRPREMVTVLERFNGDLKLYIRGIALQFIERKERPQPLIVATTKSINRLYKPPDNHPWRKPYKEIPPACQTRC